MRMFTFADQRRSLSAKVVLGLLALALIFSAIYVGGRFLNIRNSVLQRERRHALLLAEPIRFAVENLAARHPDLTTETGRLQLLVKNMARAKGLVAVAVLDATGRSVLAASIDPSRLPGLVGDLPLRALSQGQALCEPTADGLSLLVATPLRRSTEGLAPPEIFGVLLAQYDLAGPIAERQNQSLRDSGVLAVGLLTMVLVVLVGLRVFILDPVARLAGQAAALAAGRLSARSGVAVPPGGGDEIQRLAAGFDHMGTALEAAAQTQARLHDELRASEARVRAVFQHASIAISQGDSEGRILDANPAFLMLWGHTQDELRGLRWLDLTHPDDRAESKRQHQRILAGEIDGYALEQRYVRKDGQDIWASVNVASMRDEDGELQMLVLAAQDITERKAAEQAKAEREELFQAMFEDNQAIMHLYDPESGAFVDANPAAVAFYGYTREEFRGLRASRMTTLPQDEATQRAVEAMANGGVFRSEHILKNGEVRQVEGRSGPFKTGGRTLLLTTIQDMTEQLRIEDALKETEERLRQLIDIMDEGVVLTDAEGRLQFVNPVGARLLNKCPEDLIGRCHTELLHPDVLADRGGHLEARRRGSREPYETTYRSADGASVLVRITPFPLFSREGEYQGSCAIVRDITQARANEEAERLRQVRRNALLRLHEMHNAGRKDLLDFALEQIQALTASPLGHIYSYDDVRRQFTLHSWSAGVMEQCTVAAKQTVYDLDATGLWGDVVRLREPVVINDFTAPDLRQKGRPEGHVQLSRFLTLPVIRAGRVVAVVGVANKSAPYDDEDTAQLQIFTDGLWNVLERQEALAQLSAVNERFHLAVRAGRIGLWDWDLVSGAMHCDAYMEKSFGLSGRDLTGTPEDWLCRVHVDDRPRVREGLELARASGGRFEQSFRVLRPDGGVLHMDSLAVTYLGPGDEPLRMVGVNIDVTSQRQAEEKVAEGQLFLQTVIDTLPTPFVCKDGDGRYLLANKAFTNLYGLTDEDVLGQTMDQFATDSRARAHTDHDAAFLSTPAGPPLEYEVAYPPQPGESVRHWLVIKSHLPLSGGRKPGLAAITVDITERKKAEEALRQSEKRFRDLASLLRLMCDNVPDMIWAKDREKRYLFANKALCEGLLRARNTAEPEGKTDLFFAERERAAHPEDPAWHTLGELCQDSDELTQQNGASGQFDEYGNVQGTFLYLDVRKAPFVNDQGEVIGTVGSARDITEHKRAEETLRQSEELFRVLFDDAPLPHQSMDQNGCLLLANDAWLAALGYKREEVIGQSFGTFLHPDCIGYFKENFPKFLDCGLMVDAEFTMRRKDGSTLLASFDGRVSRDSKGQFQRTHCTFQDVTELRRAEDALKKAKAEAEAASLAKAQFLANMSHEIRTPLGGVIGAANLLAQSKLTAEQHQLADMAVESGRALLTLVNDILDFSKIEAGRLDLKPAPFALRADLDAVAAPFRLQAEVRGLALRLVVDETTPDALVGDSGRLDQVLRNLLGNAVKFTENGSVTLEVGPEPFCPQSHNATCLRFTVRDTGVGIDPEFLPQLFKSFSQGDHSYGKRYGGTGLGLAISRSLVERMGGHIEVKSSLGEGSAFSFMLCLALAGQETYAAEPQAPFATGKPTPAGARLRVLLADDNEIGRFLLERIIKDAGHAAVGVGDGLQVLEALARESFDLVLMDVQMPELDGLTATQRIRQGQAGAQNVGIPIVALTAYAQAEDRERFLAVGMDDYVPKPVEVGVLLAAMRRALDLRAANSAARSPAPGSGQAGPQAKTVPDVSDPATIPRFDQAFLERSFGRHGQLLAEMLTQFQALSLPEIEGNLRQALAPLDLPRCARVAHKARGSFGAVGARRAALLSQAVEVAAVREDGEAVHRHAQVLLAELAGLDEHLRQGRPWPDPDAGEDLT